ncbi:hypothetical protein M5K25_011618 [Dendrobium thyrsiflorum]|uniref:Reverse transcriptase zinc-binding domain-containing protein n=1 Tax=Dendrobium thyrsiflorum TaxID=117978 RepID=A0ABD0V418_DENTH
MAGGSPPPRPPPSPSPQPALPSPPNFHNMQPLSGAPPRAWTNLFEPSDPSSSSSKLNLSFFPSEPDIIPFSGDKLSKGASDWKLCLVGYSVGRRPFYEALLAAVKKTWPLKGSIQLLSLSDGFFLFRFSCDEDYEMVWSRGVWIASKVGIPLAADSLTTSRTRLTYARVCVLVDNEAKYPEEITVSLDGDLVQLKVQYEWRPSPCAHCKSLVHSSNLCPLNPETHQSSPDKLTNKNTRGRSSSRNPSNRIPPSSIAAPPKSKPMVPTAVSSHVQNTPPPNNNTSQPQARPSSPSSPNPPNPPNIKTIVSPHPNDIGLPLHFQPHSPTTQIRDSVNSAPLDAFNPPDNFAAIDSVAIPNLNSPTEESSSSNCDAPTMPDSSANCMVSPNKFDILQSQFEPISLEGASSRMDPVNNAKHKGNAAQPTSLSVPKKSTRDSCNNFHLSSSGRIWLKWSTAKLNFTPIFISSQMITGQITYADNQILFLSVIYASNSELERADLWNDIRTLNLNPNIPWALMGDFNCCRFASDKVGGVPITQNRLSNLNALTFDIKVMDLFSVGCPYTWFNNRLDNPIHIKLDRAMVNEQWLKAFPSSFCSILSPSCSDHCPIIIQPGETSFSRHRFLFKNFWTRMDTYWYVLLETFSGETCGNPVIDFCNKLKKLRCSIKSYTWSSSNSIQIHLDNLLKIQAQCLDQIAADPLNQTLNATLKSVNIKVAEFTSHLASWAIQRAKAKWLSQAYWIRGSILPKTILKAVRKLSSQFLFFGEIGMSHKLHMIAWGKVCLPKSCGGLGLLSPQAIQFGFNCSLICRLYNSTSPLSRWLIMRYTSPWRPPTVNATKFWRAICSTALTAKPHFKFRITPHAPIAFFWDHWSSVDSLVDYINGNLNASVGDFIYNHNWALPPGLDLYVDNSIKAIPICADDKACLLWDNYEIGYFGAFVQAFHGDTSACPWANYLWFKGSALRFSAFGWICLVGGLKTADALSRRNIHINPICPLCSLELESTNHLFFECQYSYTILLKLIPQASSLLLRPNVLQLFVWLEDLTLNADILQGLEAISNAALLSSSPFSTLFVQKYTSGKMGLNYWIRSKVTSFHVLVPPIDAVASLRLSCRVLSWDNDANTTWLSRWMVGFLIGSDVLSSGYHISFML